MNHNMRRKTLVISIAAVSLLVGVIVGSFAAHHAMGDMSRMKDSKGMEDMKGMPMEGTMPIQDTESMPGMSGAPSGAVAVPAVTRQLIGVRSAPVSMRRWRKRSVRSARSATTNVALRK
ncbi:MAG TPA: hypothetical protein PLO50_13270 [Nitrospira sp.]|nr:hypothetical protein [Nitrospira sp.]